jgi:hypothetical protein
MENTPLRAGSTYGLTNMAVAARRLTSADVGTVPADSAFLFRCRSLGVVPGRETTTRSPDI